MKPQNKNRVASIPLTLLAIVCATVSPSFAQEKEKVINPEADRLLHDSCTRLTNAKGYSFKAEVWEDVVIGTHKVSTTKTVAVQLRRPNGLQIDVHSPSRSRSFWYDGRSLTVLDRVKNLYGTVPAPATIDNLIADANDKFGIDFPLEDFLISDPYGTAKQEITGGAYFGKVALLGTPCHQVGFGTPKADFQLWISDDDGLPRKMVITYKQEPTQPQVTAIFSDWNLKPQFSDGAFTFTPPKGAGKIEILPATGSD